MIKNILIDLDGTILNFNAGERKAFIKTIKEFSINRLSIGVQSFNSNVQKIINRNCSYAELKKKTL